MQGLFLCVAGSSHYIDKLDKLRLHVNKMVKNCEYEIADGLTKDDSIAFPSDVLEEGMATTTNIEEAMDTSTVDMQPVDELGADSLDADNLGADNLDGEDAYATDDFSDSEDEWNTNPILFNRRSDISFSEQFKISCPSSEKLPSVGLSRQPIIFIRVVFPEPDGPMIATYSPSSMEKLTSLSTGTLIFPC